MNKQYGQDAQALYEAILSLKTADECEHFLEDLCTINEVMDMVQRFHAARLLYAGENYVSGAIRNLAKGNTEIAAEMIQK